MDEEAVRRRAYEISQRDDAGSEQENWEERAERELEREAESGPWAKTSSGDADSITDS